ncbi:MAG: N-acetylmuramoyl-L-alanine amidase [Myxococcaceae bacterium]|jgi:N-acetylmuramoyl-L-alanine amidase|nr:N-acetylmuramoyl-L-alanine amidase [Myxococcaceae bacterium]
MVWLSLMAVVALAQPVVVIDPGHGGAQEGAKSVSGLVEKHLALTLAKKVKAQLEAQLGATVVLTRDGDARLHLDERVALANRRKPDLFISIHANSMPTATQRRLNEGIETYFLSAAASGEDAKSVAARENAEGRRQAKGPSGDTLAFILADLQKAETHHDSSRLAYAVHEALIGVTGAQDRGVQQAPFYVLMGLEAPAVLVEVGFVSHPREGERLADAKYQQQLADGIARGVVKFLGQVSARELRKQVEGGAPAAK